MITGRKILVITLVCAFIVGLLGIPACRKASPTGVSRRGRADASGFLTLRKRTGTVTLTSADAHFVTWDGRLALVVLCDFSGTTTGGSGGDSGRCQRFDGYSESWTGHRVEWWWETVDGKSGTVVINGQRYDRSVGGLFLVYTRGEKLRIEQRKRDFEGDQKVLENLAVTDPDIEQFVAGAAQTPGGF
jgi:hypothetical protein